MTLVALGDSLTAGYGLPNGQGFVPQLEAWLRAQGADVVVKNAGVSGDTAVGGQARIDWALEPGTDAVLVELGANDMLRGLPPDQTRQALDAIMARIARDGLPTLIAGIPAPTNYGAEYKAQFDAIFPELAAKYGALHYPNFVAAVMEDGTGAAVALLQPDRLHPNRDGVARIVADIGPLVLDLLSRASE